MSMNIRTAAARIPRASIRHSTPKQMPLGRRGVGGTSQPTPKDDKATKSNMPLLAGGAVLIVGAATYAVGKSSWKHGENIANEARETPLAEKAGKTQQPGSTGTGFGADPESSGPKDLRDATQRSLRSDAPKSAYKAEEENAPKGLAGDISPQELSGSIKQGLKTDAPKTAYKAEEQGDSPSGNKGKGAGKAAV